jgi:hypothetical protein
MAQYKGMVYLRNLLSMKRLRIQKRYKYYEMKNGVEYFRTLIPAEFMHMSEVLGWCGKAVDSLGDRLCFREFANDNFDMNTIFGMNNRDVLFDSSILSALIASCSFVYISPDIDGFPRLQVIDGGDATGISDPITGLLTEGYAVISRKENKEPDIEAYFLPYATEYYQNGRMFRRDFHKSPYPLLVPIVFRPDAKRPFGHSRISRACMSIQQGALRTLLRSEVSAEFYSFPQRYITGLANDSDDGDPFEAWKATMSSFIAFTKDEDGGSPHLGQFSQQSMTPYTEQLRTFAALFAAETGLTLDDLGFVTDNPSSAEAIKAAHENLRLIARKAQRTFGSGFLNVGYLAACVRDNFPYKREQFYLTAPVWEPVFEPDAAMLSSIGDGVGKINQAVPGYFNADNLSVLTGIHPSK